MSEPSEVVALSMAELRAVQTRVNAIAVTLSGLSDLVARMLTPLPGQHCSNCGATDAPTVMIRRGAASYHYLCDRCALYVVKALDAYHAATGYRPTGENVDERA